jgi:hypothetical protein
MIENVKYSRVVDAKAMSKAPKQAGLSINNDEDWRTKDVVTLNSINSKDGMITSHLRLQIPKEDLQSVINALNKFL